MYIENVTKHPIVWKGLELPKLRLYPGMNQVDDSLFNKLKKNKVNTLHLSKNLRVVESAFVSAEDKELAKMYKSRNDKLNKAQKLATTLAKEK